MGARLGVNRDPVRSGLRERLDIGIGGRDHQLTVEHLAGAGPDALDHPRPKADVRHEVPVHDIDMHPVAAALVDRPHLLAEAGEVGGEDRRRDKDGLCHASSRCVSASDFLVIGRNGTNCKAGAARGPLRPVLAGLAFALAAGFNLPHGFPRAGEVYQSRLQALVQSLLGQQGSMAPPLLALRGIHLTFGGAPLLEDAELSVAAGERICVVGRNGSGKSTLLRIAAGIVEADGGERFAHPHATVRYLAQEADLSGFDTTMDYVEAGLRPADDRVPARLLLATLGLSGNEDPGTLSGGEARRLGLAGVLAARP